MKTLHLSIITVTGIAVIGIIIFAVILPMQPKKIMGLDEDTGIVTIGIQSYYFTTVNDTMTTYRGEGVQELFHNVVFTFFPSPGFMGPIGSCGGINFGSDVKFSDGIHELLNVPVLGLPCGKDYFKTDFSNHTNPQAGLAVYEEKVKLLVSTENKAPATSTRGEVLVPSGSPLFMDRGKTMSFGPFFFNNTVKINGIILSADNPVVVYICQSIIEHPSNQSAPLCTGKNDFMSGNYFNFYFGCYLQEYSDIVLCMRDGVSLPAGEYHVLIYSPYPTTISFKSDLIATPTK